MTPETLERHFDLLTDAPNAAKKLRELVLQLAVQGKLVEQDPSDESASALVRKLTLEKYNQIQNKQIRKSKLFTPESVDGPFCLPQSWVWVDFESIKLDSHTGLERAKRLQSESNNYPYFKMNNISTTGLCDFSDITKVDASQEELEKYKLSEGDFLFNTRNSFELVGKTCVFLNPTGEIWLFNNNILKVIFGPGVNNAFANLWFQSPSGKSLLDLLKSNTTNVAAIYQGKLNTLLFPLPPLEEQKRIVAKVDELMGLIDRLEAQGRAKRDARMRFGGAALSSLLSAEDADTFAGSWRRVRDNFDLLCAAPGGVAALRKAVLQLAVQGKLVPQDPEDEPAGVLLESIEAEKAKLVEEGKIRKTKGLTPVSSDETSIRIPNTWRWCRWDEVSLQIGDVDHKMPEEVREGVPYVSPRDFTGDNEINFSTAKKISNTDFERLSRKIQPKRDDIISPVMALLERMDSLKRI